MAVGRKYGGDLEVHVGCSLDRMVWTPSKKVGASGFWLAWGLGTMAEHENGDGSGWNRKEQGVCPQQRHQDRRPS